MTSVAHQLNIYFINVGCELAEKPPPYNYNGNTNQCIKRSFHDRFSFRRILVHDLIMVIILSKSTIGVPQKYIKLASTHVSESLTFIFSIIFLQQGIVPDILEISKVTPVDKRRESTDPTNFCPISTLSTLTQIFEKLAYKRIVNYNEKKNFLFEFQYGFRKGHSTVQAISDLANTLGKAIDNNLQTRGFLRRL